MEPVYLYAYNLMESGSFSSTSGGSGDYNDLIKRARECGLFTLNLIAWHTSIVIYGKEISFGMEGMKIEDLKHKNETEKERPIKKILMGHTGLSWKTLHAYLEYLSENKFTAKKYNVLNHNCNVFTAFLCKNLLEKDIPEEYSSAVPIFFNRLANIILSAFAFFPVKGITFKSS